MLPAIINLDLRKVLVVVMPFSLYVNLLTRRVVAGSTVNLCAVDLSKAFDKVNHHAMFIKLIIKDTYLSIYWNC